MTLLDQTKLALKKYGLSPNYLRGQNFLIDEKVLGLIVETAELKRGDWVLEVGPGLGILTRELASKVERVIAIEVDKKLTELLRASFFSQKNVEIINQDIFKVNLPQTFSDHEYKVVANIPYNITSGFLELMLTLKNKPESMTLLVQKEVAERVCAKKGEMSILSLSVQLFGEPKIVSVVKAKSFWPEPKVDSAILQISNIKEPKDLDIKKFFQLLHIGFSSRRKTLINNLSAGYHLSKLEVEKVIVGMRLLPTVRAQELGLGEWKDLLKNF